MLFIVLELVTVREFLIVLYSVTTTHVTFVTAPNEHLDTALRTHKENWLLRNSRITTDSEIQRI